MEIVILIAAFIGLVRGYAPLHEPRIPIYTDELPNELERMNMESGGSFFDLGSKLDAFPFVAGRRTKDGELSESLLPDYEMLMGEGHYPSIRDSEYLQHSSLWGNKHMTGGGSEGMNINGELKNKEVKTDGVLPAYCNPPNPCPVGYNSEDGCIENFENSAAFSRAYQASQDCMCDTEHMFDCQLTPDSNDLHEQREFLNNLHDLGEHKSVMAKKFYNQKLSHQQKLSVLNDLVKQAEIELGGQTSHGIRANENPFLRGEKLPIAAKKGNFSPSPSKN